MYNTIILIIINNNNITNIILICKRLITTQKSQVKYSPIELSFINTL